MRKPIIALPALPALPALALVLGLWACAAQAQVHRILVGFPPGGSLNVIARALADRLGEGLGRPVIVENRAGAGGQIAAEALKGAAPDGATLLLTPDGNIVIYPSTVAKPTYDPLADFAPVTFVAGFRNALAVNAAAVPATSFQEFVAWSRAQAKGTGYGTSGAGTSLHFYGLLLAQVTGAKLEHVGYRGTGPALIDLTGGHVPAAVLPLGNFVPHVKAGKVRVLGTSGPKRAANLPEVPTFRELGYPALDLSGWYGIFAQAGTSPEMLLRYSDILGQALRTPAIADILRRYDLEPQEMSVSEFAAMIKANYDRWRPVIQASGFTPESR